MGSAFAQDDVTRPELMAMFANIVPTFIGKGSKVIGNSAVKASLLPTAGSGSLAIPANQITAGSIVSLRIGGTLTTRVLAPGNLDFEVTLGGVVIGTATISTLLASLSGGFWFEAFLTIGDAGACMLSGNVSHTAALGSAGVVFLNTSGSPVVDPTQALTVGLNAKWASADALNVITTRAALIALSRASTVGS